ncbi:MAG: LptF/LptG family permease [Flavobacterium sp.]|nr:LptF/LptG family permease [Flavobacterium sp.]
MKILDKYILTTFLKTFTSVFVILFFIFILQTVWLFIAELAGKDLDFIMIIKFLGFSMPNIVPLVLPLSILLASIMTFGDLSENYEFAAMKSSGVSLQRAMRSLVYFISILSVAAFAFANNIIPYSQYKFLNFKANIAQVKPALAIAEGQFSDVGTYNIKVDKKSGENGNILTGITIHKKSNNGNGNTTVIKAKNGELLSSEDSNILQLVLYDGYQFEDVIPKKYEDRKKLPFAKSSFKKYNLNMDLTQLNKVDVNKEQISNTSTMLNIGELNYTLDSLNKDYEKELVSYADNIHIRTGVLNKIPKSTLTAKDTSKTKAKDLTKDLLGDYTNSQKVKIFSIAKSNASSTAFTIDGTKDDFYQKQRTINGHWLSIYDKFVIAYACFLMFFIGAPLGAIIRKGGLGLPIVFAILIFITFHFVNTFGKKVAQENGITPFLGAWMSSIILTPLAILLTFRATNDISITINFDWITIPVQKLYFKLFPKKQIL